MQNISSDDSPEKRTSWRPRRRLSDIQIDELRMGLARSRGRHAVALRAMVEIMLASGARASELAHARWEDLDPFRGAFTVSLHRGDLRWIALPAAAWQALATLKDAPCRGHAVFPNLAALRAPFDRCVKRTGMPRVRLGAIRLEAKARILASVVGVRAATGSEIATLPQPWLDALIAARVAPEIAMAH